VEKRSTDELWRATIEDTSSVLLSSFLPSSFFLAFPSFIQFFLFLSFYVFVLSTDIGNQSCN
jgi:hypothetical protein